MRRVVSIGVLLVVSAVLIAVIVLAVGLERTAAAVAEAGVSAFAAVGAMAAAFLLIQTISWAILNRPIGHRIPFRTLLEASTVGLAGNLVTPSTLLGGEPLKVLYARRVARLPVHEVAGTVLLSKYLEAVSFVLFFSVSAVIATVRYRDALFGSYLAVGVTLMVVAGVLLVFCAVLCVSLWRRWQPLTRVLGLLGRLPFVGRRIQAFRRRTRQMEDQVSRVFCEEGAAAWQVFGAQLVGHAAIFLKPALFFTLGAGITLDLGQLCLLFMVGQALLAFQITPSGAGVLDTGLLGAFALMGLSEPTHLAQCVAFLLCLRLWDGLVIGAGVLLAARHGLRVFTNRSDSPPADSPDSD